MGDDIKELVTSKILGTFPDVISIYIFGSFGSEYQTRESDLDLAVYSTSPIDTVALWNLSQEIAIAIDRDVDIVDLKKASTVFQNEIIHTGTRIYCSDPKTMDFTESTYLSMYRLLNEKRAEILKDLKRPADG